MVLIEGDLKRVLAQETGLEPKEQRLLFQGKEKDDEECLHMVGVKDMSKVVLLEDPASKERKLEEMKINQTVLKACEEVAKVRAEVDKLSEKVSIHRKEKLIFHFTTRKLFNLLKICRLLLWRQLFVEVARLQKRNSLS